VRKYAHKLRWISYWHQIQEVLSGDYKTILIIGIGDGIVPEVIRHCCRQKGGDTKVLTLDLEEPLKPDIVGDLRDIKSLTKGLNIDCILCSQVLEHIEFKYFESILYDMSQVANKVIISLPHAHRTLFRIKIKIPFITEKTFEIMVPRKFKGIQVHKYHHWELGSWGVCINIKKIESIFLENFVIQKKFYVQELKYHLFYVLQSKNKQG
jgi:hypothetical protein